MTIKDSLVEEYRQDFWCPECNKTTSVPIYNGDDWASIIYRMSDKHAELSPECTEDVINMKVLKEIRTNDN